MHKKMFCSFSFLFCLYGFFAQASLPITSDLVLWLDASNPQSLVSQDGSLTHGDRILIWKDVLTGDNTVSQDFIQADPAHQPVWFERISVLNGSSAVLFDGIKTFLQSSTLYIGPETTVFILAQSATQLNTPGSVHRPILAADNNPFKPDGNGYGIAYQHPMSRELVVSLGNDTEEEKLVGTDFNSEDWEMNIITFRRQGSVLSEIHKRTARNAEDVLMGTETALTRTSGLHTGYELGAETGHSARYYKGFLSEVIIYNRYLNDTEMQQVSDYLYSKHFESAAKDPFNAQVYLPFDEGWDNSGLLFTEKATVATYNGITPKFATGIRGKCFDLSHAVMSTSAGCLLYGISGTEDTELETQLNGAKSITLCGWFNAVNEPLKAFSGFLGRTGQLMVRSYDNESRLVLGINNNWTSLDSDVTFNETNEWIFWAVTYDGTQSSSNVKWYKGDTNGNFSLLKVQSLSAGHLANVHEPLALGNLLTSGAYCFAGFMDEMRIFTSQSDASGALSLSQLEAVYEHGKSPFCGDPQHPYPAGDVNRDCTVNFEDIAEFFYQWQLDVN